MTALLPSERQQFSRNILPRRESFEVLYHLHFDNLCADFQEDIRFKFSLGFTALMKKFMTMGKKQKYDMYGNNVPRGLGSPGSPQTPTNEYTQPQDDWSLMSKVAIGALTSQGNISIKMYYLDLVQSVPRTQQQWLEILILKMQLF